MPYGPWDEYFVHQLPRTLDHVHDSDASWSDRCYINVHSPDGELLVTMGYGNNPNAQAARGYVKVARADTAATGTSTCSAAASTTAATSSPVRCG